MKKVDKGAENVSRDEVSGCCLLLLGTCDINNDLHTQKHNITKDPLFLYNMYIYIYLEARRDLTVVKSMIYKNI